MLPKDKLSSIHTALTNLACMQGQAFGWEAVMTFVLVAVVYAVAIGKPSFTETGPIAVGFSLWASALIGNHLLTGGINPDITPGSACCRCWLVKLC